MGTSSGCRGCRAGEGLFGGGMLLGAQPPGGKGGHARNKSLANSVKSKFANEARHVFRPNPCLEVSPNKPYAPRNASF